jgi:hypothetical protein
MNTMDFTAPSAHVATGARHKLERSSSQNLAGTLWLQCAMAIGTIF